MKICDLKKMKGKKPVYDRDEFKARYIQLPKGGSIPSCDMSCYVIFIVLEGDVEITVNEDKAILRDGKCLFSEPGIYSMNTEEGAKILGIQVQKVDR